MPGSYRHIQQYEKEILKLREDGLTKKEIGERLGFSFEQIKGFLKRYRKKQAKADAGIALKRKGRPPKNCVASEKDKVAELKYILARKETKIKSLESVIRRKKYHNYGNSLHKYPNLFNRDFNAERPKGVFLFCLHKLGLFSFGKRAFFSENINFIKISLTNG